MSAEPERPNAPHADPVLQRRLRILIPLALVGSPMLGLGLLGESMGLPGGVRAVLVTLGMASSLAMFWVLEPFRRIELRRTVGTPVSALTWPLLARDAAILVWIAVVPPLVLDETWTQGFARAFAIAVYLAIFLPLSRYQRRGFSPYWRPAWYGFVAAGAIAGVAWSAVVAAPVEGGIIKGIINSLMHYLYFRWVLRGAIMPEVKDAHGPHMV